MRGRAALVCAVPALWIALAMLMQLTAGSYSPLDPDMYYLLSALDLAEWRSIGLYHHPGTTAEVLGAVVIRATYALAGTGGVQHDVLTHPDRYLANIHLASGALNAVSIWIAGVIVLRATASVWTAVLIQLPVLLSALIWRESFVRFTAEPFLVFASMPIAALVVAFTAQPASHKWLPVAFGALCGFGMATKLTFVPIVIIPLVLLRGLLPRIVFLLATAAFAVIFTLPIADRYTEFGKWTYRVSSHTGIYGTGEPGIVDPAAYGEGLIRVLIRNPLFDAVTIITVIVLIRAYRRARPVAGEPFIRALSAVALSQIVAFGVVAKYAPFGKVDRYLIGSYCLLGLTVWLCLEVVQPASRVLVRLIAAPLTIAGLMAPVLLGYEVYGFHEAQRQPERVTARLRQLDGAEFQGFARLYDPFVPTPLRGLLQATFYSTAQAEALAEAYPSTYFCLDVCDAGNWTGKPVAGTNPLLPVTTADILKEHDGKVVLIAGEEPTIQIVSGTISNAKPAAPASEKSPR